MTDQKYYSYKPLTEDWCFHIDELDFSIKNGYELQYKGRSYERQTTPYNLQVYTIGNRIIVLDLGWVGHDGGYEINGVYEAVEETDEDKNARLEREESKAQKEKDLRAQERAAKKVAKQQALDKAKKDLEKAGYKITK